MAAFGKDVEVFSASRTVKIIDTETVENYTVYVIEITIGPYHWTVKHRYSEFFDLHEKLVVQYKLDKNLLPPKKLFGNQSEAFIRKRQGELEIYLQTVLHHLSGIPSHLANFLHFHKYEIHGLTQALAEELFHKGDLILQAGETFHVTPLQLHAISARLKLPEPTCAESLVPSDGNQETGDATKDLGHVLDFITQLRYLKIIGSNQGVCTSNIVMNELTFDMLSFKNIESLELQECRCEMMTEVEHLKKTLTKLHIHKCIKNIKDVLLLGIGNGAWHGGEDEALIIPAWSALASVDLSHNNLSSIDESVQMMPAVEFLDLSDNELQDVQHLQYLTKLTHIDLSNNNIHILNSLHTKLGNIKSLCLAGNSLESLLGFSKLYSLEQLDVSGNEISQVLEVRHISNLPCLESLVLTGNPVTIVVDYRTKILELFGNRATEVCLDGQKPSQKELDTVAILLAIQKSKESKERARRHAAKKPAVEAHITDAAPGAHGNTCGSASSASGNQCQDDLFEIQLLRHSKAERDQPPAASPLGLWFAESLSRASMAANICPVSHLQASIHRENEPVLAQRSTTPAPHHLATPAAHSSTFSPPLLSNPGSGLIWHVTASGGGRPAEHPDLFRMQVEAIREQGGAAWLTLLNAMTTQHAGDLLLPNNQGTGRRSPRSRHRSRNTLEQHNQIGVGRQPQAHTDSSGTDDGDSDTCSIMSVGTTGCLMLPETLPGKNDSAFTTFLQKLVPNSAALCARLRQGEERKREERPVHVMWCSVLCYTDPYKERPACIYVTTENLHLLYVSALCGASGWPELTLVYCMPLCNMQQLVVGYEEVYVRLEEAFVGPQGTFTLITYSPNKTRVFMEALKGAIRRAIPDGEPRDDPHVVWNGETEMSLKAVLNRVECLPNLANVPLILYMLVQTLDVSSNKQVFCTHSLVITAKYLYIVREDYILWPQPTYGIGPSTRPQFEVIHSYPIAGRISGIQMYDTDSLYQNVETLPENFMATGSSISIMPNFIGFGVKLVFEMGHQQGTKDLDIRVPTSGMRDKFLATLTQVRRDMSERSPSPPKGRSSHKAKAPREVLTMVDDNRSDTSSHGSRSSADRHSVTSSISAAYSTCSTFSQECGHGVPANPDAKGDKPCTEAAIGLTTDASPAKPIVLDDEIIIQAAAATIPEDDVDVEHLKIIAASQAAEAADAVSEVLPHSQPSTLPFVYPTMDLLNHLTSCNEQLALLHPLSEGLRNLASMDGEELINYFHSQVALIGGGAEELSHLLWSSVTPYTSSRQEITTCILLSTKSLYFISDSQPKKPRSPMPVWKTHNRHKSDSLIAMPHRDMDPHHSSGILLPGSPNAGPAGNQRVKVYMNFGLKELRQVNIGMFDQSFRLAGDNSAKVLTCITRDNCLTELFVKRLMMALTSLVPSPSPEVTSSDSEPDVYKMFGRCVSRSESLEFVHPSRVKFVYPSEDAVSDLTYLMVDNVRGKKPMLEDVKIYLYLLLFQIDPPTSEGATGKAQDYSAMKPRTLIVTNSHTCLAIEDHVSYPLPDFVKGLPENPNFEVTDVCHLDFLRRVIMSDFTSHDLTLVFADESEDIVVDLSCDHYSVNGTDVLASAPVPEVKWTLVIQNIKDRDRLLKLLGCHWTECHDGGELSVQVSA